MTKEELMKSHERILFAKRQVEAIEIMTKASHEAFDPLLNLVNNDRFWPWGWTAEKFVELETEMNLLDATATLARERCTTAEKLARDLAQYLKIEDLYRRMKQSPPTGRNGISLSQEFDQALIHLEAALEEIPYLRSEADYHITGIKTLVD